MLWWLWVSIAFVIIIAEMFIPTGFVLVLVGLSFLITGIAVALGLKLVWAQYAICAFSLLVLLIFFRKKIVTLFGGDTAQGYSDFLNEEVVIVSSIPAGQVGQGELRGSQWTVRNTGSVELKPGERCRVQRVDGLVLETQKL